MLEKGLSKLANAGLEVVLALLGLVFVLGETMLHEEEALVQ